MVKKQHKGFLLKLDIDEALIYQLKRSHADFSIQFVCKIKNNQVTFEQMGLRQVRLDYYGLGQVTLGQVRLGSVRLSQVWSGSVRLGQIMKILCKKYQVPIPFCIRFNKTLLSRFQFLLLSRKTAPIIASNKSAYSFG